MSKFQPITFFDRRSGNTGSKAVTGTTRQGTATNGYQLMPFKFTELDADRFVMTNIAGEYLVLPKYQVRQFADRTLPTNSDAYIDLRSHQFLIDANTSVAPDLLAIKLRTRYSRLANFTGLHIFVVSLRCEHSCPYCQVSRQNEDKGSFDMTQEQASSAIDLALRSPADAIKIEFQGGEPLLNFDLIRYIVCESKRRNKKTVRRSASSLPPIWQSSATRCWRFVKNMRFTSRHPWMGQRTYTTATAQGPAGTATNVS